MYGMGGMYGGGLGMGGMYGGGLGMGSMYGGGLGMGSGMYGGGMYGSSGLGMGTGMYGGGGLGMGGTGGLYGNNNNMGGGSLLGGNGFGNNNNSLLGGNNNSSSSGGLLGAAGTAGDGSLLPAPPGDAQQQPASPINQVAALPPLNESPEARARRLRSEQRKQRQLIQQQRAQLRQIRMKAKLEIAGHLTNVFVQTLRSTMELFAVCFGTYYSMKAVRAFANSQEAMSGMVPPSYMRGPAGQLVPMSPAAAAAQQQQAAMTAKQGAADAAVKAGGGGGRRWRTWAICVVLFVLGEVIYGLVTRSRATVHRRGGRAHARALSSLSAAYDGGHGRHRVSDMVVEDEYGNVLTHDDAECDTDSTDSLCSLDDDALEAAYASAGSRTHGAGEQTRSGPQQQQRQSSSSPYADEDEQALASGSGRRRVFVAMFDYTPTQSDGAFAAFRAGDEFIVDDYVDNGWCAAIAMDSNTHTAASPRRMLVPGNFLRPLETATKL